MQPTFKGVLVVVAITTAVVLAQYVPLPSPASQPSSAVAQAQTGLAVKAAGNASVGRSLFSAKGCVACHTAQGVPGAVGTIGPSLNGLGDPAKHPTLADGEPNTPINIAAWIKDPASRKPGTQMPNLGLSAKEADDLAAFLVTLK
jgi:mono/diheme cytochrome c family protein